MNTQVNQSENMSESDKIKSQINKKLSDLSDTKTKYVYYMFQLVQVKNPKLMEYVCQLMTLLRYAINIKKDPVLEELDECFTSLMLTYIFDISELINQQINEPTDIEKYNDRHQNLIRINKEIEHQVNNYNSYYLNEFKQTLLKV
jgi:hypothetical protein